MIQRKVKWMIGCTLVVSLFSSGVYAGTVLQTYKTVRGDFATVEQENIHKNRIALKVNGVESSKATWYTNDTTYVPLRDAAELLGANVHYNAATMTAELTTKSSGSPSTEPVGTRSNPIPLGKNASANVTIYASSVPKSAVLDVRVVKITRGSAALKLIKAENPYNQTPAKGYEYVMINVAVKVRNATTNDYPFMLDQWHFEAVSQNGNTYEIPSVVTPNVLNAKIYNNGSANGNMTWQVKTGDNLLLNFKDVKGKSIFFATK